jgi:hypothetical protein
MKRGIALTAMIISALSCGCASGSSPDSSGSGGGPTAFDYDGLYAKEEHPYEEKQYDSISSSYGYIGHDEQGYNSWYYIETDETGVGQPMVFDDEKGYFRGDGSRLSKETVVSSGTYFATRRYVLGKDGAGTTYGHIKVTEGNPTLEIKANGETILSLSLKEDNDRYFEASFTGSSGEYLDFILKGESTAIFDPCVSYDFSNDCLYHKTPMGKCYGDVYPYYDVSAKQLYLYYLYSDNARNGDYLTALDISSDFLTYSNVPEEGNYDLWQHYKENGNLSLIRDCSRYIETDKYEYGIRDHYLYYDEENKRDILIAGCYHKFDATAQTSDLVIYTSNDEFGFDWNKPGNVIASYSRNLPECPGLAKIGNRWYAFVSVAYNTVHQVGPLQYWMGEEWEDVGDIDFEEKAFSFLDGEDLCAARVFPVGPKHYMFGWIPYTYDTMPWSPWGGYLNLPREVVQHEDGTLGGRLDPGLKKVIEFGQIDSVDQASAEDGEIQLFNDVSRSIVSFHLDMDSASSAYYLIKQGEKRYEVGIMKKDEKAYLRVASPDDDSHTLNSEIEIENKGSYDLYIVNDGAFIEVCVDDSYCLTAHTAMDDSRYNAFLLSEGEASIKNVSLMKLTAYWTLL